MKICLNSDGQQFYQYQQNEQSPLILTHWTLQAAIVYANADLRIIHILYNSVYYSTRNKSRSKERISPYQFPSDDDFRSKSRQDQKEYQIELERQVCWQFRKSQESNYNETCLNWSQNKLKTCINHTLDKVPM